MERQAIPLTEFDERKEAKFSPEHFGKRKILPEKCVISFSNTSVEAVAQKFGNEILTHICTCTVDLPVYRVRCRGEEIALVCGFLGAAGAAAQLEELITMGAKKFVVCGAAGTLTPNPVGALVAVERAVRDEGTSFHYMPPSYEIEADGEAVSNIVKSLEREGIPCTRGKTWTTDGLYRETEEKIALRRAENCITVEMEASALAAVARFRGVKLGQILYCGDDLSGAEYDHRNFFDEAEIRRNLTEWAMACVCDF